MEFWNSKGNSERKISCYNIRRLENVCIPLREKAYARPFVWRIFPYTHTCGRTYRDACCTCKCAYIYTYTQNPYPLIHAHTCEHANTHVHIDIHANTLTHTLNNPPRVRVPQIDLQVPITRTHCTLALHPNPKVEPGTWSCHTQRTHLTKPCWLLHSCNSELFHIARRGTKGITPNSHICTV